MYSSIDQVVDKIEIQAKRLKEKLKDHKHQAEARRRRGGEERRRTRFAPAAGLRRGDLRPQAARASTEAVEALQGGPDHFLVFHNAKNGLVNVLYKRGDGTFGLVQPPA